LLIFLSGNNNPMPDETSTPPDSTGSPKAADTQAPPSEPVSAPVIEPTPPPPEAAAPAPEPNTPTTPSQENTTPPQSSPQLRGGGGEGAGGEETPAPPKSEDPEEQQAVDGAGATGQEARVSEAVSEPVQTNPPAPQTEPPPLGKEELKNAGIIAELLTKARAKIQERRRKKLEKIMAKVTETGKITNDEVEKLLHVSDATATRYLQALEKENKIKQTGVTGTVFYEKS